MAVIEAVSLLGLFRVCCGSATCSNNRRIAGMGLKVLSKRLFVGTTIRGLTFLFTEKSTLQQGNEGRATLVCYRKSLRVTCSFDAVLGNAEHYAAVYGQLDLPNFTGEELAREAFVAELPHFN